MQIINVYEAGGRVRICEKVGFSISSQVPLTTSGVEMWCQPVTLFRAWSVLVVLGLKPAVGRVTWAWCWLQIQHDQASMG
jgi:hypothetical protein